jgi:hypothetical protein
MFSYFQNSCYTDTLFTVLFKSSSGFWLNNILSKEQDTREYDKLVCGDKILNQSEIIEYAERIRLSIKDLLVQILEGNVTTCTNIRSIFKECLPQMQVGGTYVTYNPDEIYNLLCDLFPSIKLNSTYIYNSVTSNQKISMYTMWEYMGRDESKIILWDTLDDPVLVFVNGGIPPITKYRETGFEDNQIYKVNSFNEVILDKYVLIGVITLLGYTLGQHGGEHYVCYYRKDNGDIHYYDDIKLTDTKIDNFPISGVWEYSNRRIPYMYFYQKINSLKNDVQKKIRENLIIKKTQTMEQQILSAPQLSLPKFNFNFQTKPNSNVSGLSSPMVNLPVLSSPMPNLPLLSSPTRQINQPISNLHVIQPSLPVIQPISLPVISQPISLPVISQPISLPVISQPISLPVISQPISNLPVIQPSLPILRSPVLPKIDSGYAALILGHTKMIQPTVITQTVKETPIIVKKNIDEIITTQRLPVLNSPQRIIRSPINQTNKGSINIPTGSTIVENVKLGPPKIISTQEYGMLAYTNDNESIKNKILDELIVNKNKLLKGKYSVKNPGFHLSEIQQYAKRLGLNSQQHKDVLIDKIFEMIKKRESQLSKKGY